MNVLLLLLASATVPGGESAKGALPLLELPACEPAPAGDEIDLEARCVLGVCAGDTWETYTAVWGPADCDPSYSTRLECEWDNDASVFFDDDDGDEVPDAGSMGDNIYLHERFEGADSDGYRPGVSMACYLDHYGYPLAIDLDLVDEVYVMHDLDYDDLGFSVGDWDDDDGIVDVLILRDG